jgi:hypothetical protein
MRAKGPSKPRKVYDSVLFLRVGVREAAQPNAGGDLNVLRVLEQGLVGVVAVDADVRLGAKDRHEHTSPATALDFGVTPARVERRS